MANRKISDLTALTTPASGDYLPIVDISEAAAADKNKRITVGELLRGVPDGTAGAPGIAFESDGGNGFYLAGTDTIGASTNGVNRLTLSTSALTSTVPISATSFTPTSSTIPTNGVYLPSANNVAISTNGTGRLFIDNSGNVGVGTTSPNSELHIAKTGASDEPTLRIESENSNIYLRTAGSSGSFPTGGGGDDGELLYLGGDFRIGIGSASKDLIFINGAGFPERARIDSSGRLLVGTSSALSNSANDRLQIAAASASGISTVQHIYSFNSGGGIASLNFNRSNSNTLGTNTLVTSGQGIGSVNFSGADGSNYINAARIIAEVDGTPGTNDMPGRLVFSTTADGASSPTERMRINSSGAIGLAGANFGTAGQVLVSNGSSSAPSWENGTDRIVAGGAASGTQIRVYESGISGYAETTVSGIPSARTTISGYYENASGVASGIFYPVVTQVDIGTAPNEVPLAGMLGELAFLNYPFVRGGSSTATSGTIVIDADLYERFNYTASIAAGVTVQVQNLTNGKEVQVYVRNTNATARPVYFEASTTTSGFTGVNLAVGNPVGAPSSSSITLSGSTGTALVWVGNINGTIVGGAS